MNDHHDDEIPESEIRDPLARLRIGVDVPPVDPARERQLLAAFDAHWSRPRVTASRWVWGTAVALVIVTVGLNWMVMRNGALTSSPVTAPVNDMAGFVPWPGAELRPPFESGSVVRVDLPVSALPALGLPSPLSVVTSVQADIVIGQDGFARAVRLVQ